MMNAQHFAVFAVAEPSNLCGLRLLHLFADSLDDGRQRVEHYGHRVWPTTHPPLSLLTSKLTAPLAGGSVLIRMVFGDLEADGTPFHRPQHIRARIAQLSVIGIAELWVHDAAGQQELLDDGSLALEHAWVTHGLVVQPSAASGVRGTAFARSAAIWSRVNPAVVRAMLVGAIPARPRWWIQ